MLKDYSPQQKGKTNYAEEKKQHSVYVTSDKVKGHLSIFFGSVGITKSIAHMHVNLSIKYTN